MRFYLRLLVCFLIFNVTRLVIILKFTIIGTPMVYRLCGGVTIFLPRQIIGRRAVSYVLFLRICLHEKGRFCVLLEQAVQSFALFNERFKIRTDKRNFNMYAFV